MFIKTIIKTDRKVGKRYEYYRLSESYRIGNKIRHRTIISLGKLNGVETKSDKKLLADTIESLVRGQKRLYSLKDKPIIEKYARKFTDRIINERLLDTIPDKRVNNKADIPAKDYQHVDLNSMNHEDVRQLGSEWLCKQTVDKFGLKNFLITSCGLSEELANMSIMHIISRAVYPGSEHKTAQWVRQSSAVSRLCQIPLSKVYHTRLYSISRILYQHKTKLERYLSRKTNELFDIQDKIIFYDLTNTYFEGRKSNSKIARFGVSKEKRSDAKLVSLATVINAEGFIKYSRICEGNISDSKTLETTIKKISKETSLTAIKPVIVMDAGIITEDNTNMLKRNNYDYICLNRTKLKDYKEVNPSVSPMTIYDKKNNPIELKPVEKSDCKDTYLYVRSQQKAAKESSMREHFSQRYEENIENIKQSLSKKGGTKKLDKVWERIGRLKERYPSANKHYDIKVIPDNKNKKAIDIKLNKKELKPRTTDGVYFIRTNLDKKDEKTLWTIYNTLTEIEATFRLLKTDLSLRPVFHKNDEFVKAHLFLGLLAYQVVATIRYQLKSQNINYDWRNIVRKMNTQKEVTTTIKNKKGDLIRIKKCSTPIVDVKQIYEALKLKYQPYYIKKSVVPEKMKF